MRLKLPKNDMYLTFHEEIESRKKGISKNRISFKISSFIKEPLAKGSKSYGIMTVSHQKFREILLVVLFSKAFHENDPAELKKLVMKELKLDAASTGKAMKKIDALMQHIEAIDGAITRASTTFDFHRIQKVELAILRLIAYELLYEKSLDKSVLIAEAKRLAKKFCAPEAASFCQALAIAISAFAISNE